MKSLQKAIEINNLAYKLELLYPKLSFFEINKLIVAQINKPKPTLVK